MYLTFIIDQNYYGVYYVDIRKGDIFMNDNDNDKGEFGIVLAAIAAVPVLIEGINEILKSEITLPNIPWPAFDSDWDIWDTLGESHGWRLQQNEITKHCRIIDPDNVRRAWGTKNGMFEALKSLEKKIDS